MSKPALCVLFIFLFYFTFSLLYFTAILNRSRKMSEVWRYFIRKQCVAQTSKSKSKAWACQCVVLIIHSAPCALLIRMLANSVPCVRVSRPLLIILFKHQRKPLQMMNWWKSCSSFFLHWWAWLDAFNWNVNKVRIGVNLNSVQALAGHETKKPFKKL